MRYFTIIMVVIALLSGCNRVKEAIPQEKAQQATEKAETQYRRELEEIRKNLNKGDIKIKLKRDAKGGYNWEITGKDAQEVLRTNEQLRKRLETAQ